jgi:hypothetical protein
MLFCFLKASDAMQSSLEGMISKDISIYSQKGNVKFNLIYSARW